MRARRSDRVARFRRDGGHRALVFALQRTLPVKRAHSRFAAVWLFLAGCGSHSGASVKDGGVETDAHAGALVDGPSADTPAYDGPAYDGPASGDTDPGAEGDTGAAGCPAARPVPSTECTASSPCYYDSLLCFCLIQGGATNAAPMHWYCGTAPPGCPDRLPAMGSPCAVPGMSCRYDVGACANPRVDCQDGKWQYVATPCASSGGDPRCDRLAPLSLVAPMVTPAAPAPGDTVRVQIGLHNTGPDYPFYPGATLSSSTAGVGIVQPYQGIALLASGGTRTLTWDVSLSPSLVLGGVVDLSARVAGEGRADCPSAYVLRFSISLGAPAAIDAAP
jgi:hypothetical protein